MKSLTFLIAIFSPFTLAQQSNTSFPLKTTQVTTVQDSYPHPSPDGTRIVFQSNRSGRWQIHSMKLETAELKQLTTSEGNNLTPKWSPDGRRIVFASDRDNDEEIYIMDADGSHQKRLTNQPGDDSHPNWSPDGTRIIFNSARATPDLNEEWSKQHIEIFSMNTDGKDVRQITKLKTISTYPSWSPDAGKIVFRMVTSTAGFQWDLSLGSRNSEVFVINADGTSPINVSQSAAYDGWPAWSPDGKWIVFASNRTGPANTAQLFIVNPNGTGLKQISDGKYSYAQPMWSSDSKQIFAYQNWEFSNLEFGHIWVFQL